MERKRRNLIYIEEVFAERTVSLRLRVLRPDLSPDAEQIEYAPEGARHFAALEDGQVVVGACYILLNVAPFDSKKWALQLRGMAVEPALQGQGIGASLVKHVLTLAEEEQVEILWFNARRVALGFYAKLGFHKWGEEFEIPNIGPHTVMFRTLSP